MPPDVSVIMPAYNAGEHIVEAISSVLDQSFSSLELLIVDDGSIDDTAEKVRPFLVDERVHYIRQSNQGASAARNAAISQASGRFIACMDADDVSMPDRLKTQVDFLEKNPPIGLCGSWGETIEATARPIVLPVSDADIRANLLFENCFIHSAVMFRRSLLQAVTPAYREMLAEDYDLWGRLGDHTQMRNIPQRLIKYRVHADQTTAKKSEDITEGAMLVRRRRLQALLGRDISEPEMQAFRRLVEPGGNGQAALETLVFVFCLLHASDHGEKTLLRKILLARSRRLLRATATPSPLALVRFCIHHGRDAVADFGFPDAARLLRAAIRRPR